MAEEPLGALAHHLGVQRDALAFLDPVDDADLHRLRAAVVEAHQRQERALAEAFDGTIRLVPRPLRGRVRKLLLGG